MTHPHTIAAALPGAAMANPAIGSSPGSRDFSEGWKQHSSCKKTWFSPLGEVWKRINASHPERRQWVQRAYEIDKDGYVRVTIKGAHFLVHRAVYQLFVGPLVDGLVVCHRDGNPQNNTPNNLLQATQKVNLSHKVEHGTDPVGERHPRALISDVEAARIKVLLHFARRSPNGWLARGEASRLSTETGVSIHIIRDINCGKAWGHVVLGN